MNTQSAKESASFTKTVVNWHNARAVFSAFIAAHPELGLRDSPITFRNFCYRHGRTLQQIDVMRKPFGIRSSAIFDVNRFDEVVFNLISRAPTRTEERTQPLFEDAQLGANSELR
jgi:hypothetical protein